MGTGRNECRTQVTHLDPSTPLPHYKCEQSCEATRTVKGMIIKSSDISGMKVCFIPPGMSSGFAEGLSQDKRNLKEDGRVVVTARELLQ